MCAALRSAHRNNSGARKPTVVRSTEPDRGQRMVFHGRWRLRERRVGCRCGAPRGPWRDRHRIGGRPRSGGPPARDKLRVRRSMARAGRGLLLVRSRHRCRDYGRLKRAWATSLHCSTLVVRRRPVNDVRGGVPRGSGRAAHRLVSESVAIASRPSREKPSAAVLARSPRASA